MKKDDIHVEITDEALIIQGERRQELADTHEGYQRSERSYGSFTRSFTLPFTPDPDKIEADCDQGVLTIRLPRGAEQERSKRITIGGTGGKTIEAKGGEQPAVGKDWNKESGLTKEQAEKGQGAPA